MKRISILSAIVLMIILTLSLTACSSGGDQNSGTDSGQQTDSGSTGTATSTGPLTGKDLYRQALEASVSLGTTQPYMSFQTDTGSIRLGGEFKGDFNGGNGRLKGNLDINGVQGGMPLAMAMDMISIEEQDKTDTFMRITSVSTSSSQYSSALQAYFAPAINKWVKSDGDGSGQGQPKSFEDGGPVAAIDAISIFVPMLSLNDADRQTFLATVDKYDLYTVGDVQMTQFHGVNARKVTVTVKKDDAVAMDEELSQSLSPDSKYKKSESKYIDELFGKDGTLTADVYLASDKAEMIGVDLLILLDQPVTEDAFDTSMQRIKTSAFFDYGRDLTVTAPETFITESEMDALMSR